MSNNATILCGCCMGGTMLILGILQLVAWFFCFKLCLTEQATGGNFYLGCATGVLSIIVGILGISYLCFLNSSLLFISVLFDVPLVFSSAICSIISIVNTNLEISNNGPGLLFFTIQSVCAGLITIFAIATAIQYSCSQNKAIVEEEKDNDDKLAVRQGQEKFNPLVDDDGRLPVGGIPRSMAEIYDIGHNFQYRPGGRGNNLNGRAGGGSIPITSSNHAIESAGAHLGRRSPNPLRQIGRVPRDGRSDPNRDGFRLNPFSSDSTGSRSRHELSGDHRNNGSHTGNNWLPDFDLSRLSQDNASYSDNPNFFH